MTRKHTCLKQKHKLAALWRECSCDFFQKFLERRNEIIPFLAIYKKVGYVMKLDRETTRKALQLLSLHNRIRTVKFHGVTLDTGTPLERSTVQMRSQDAHASAKHPSIG